MKLTMLVILISLLSLSNHFYNEVNTAPIPSDNNSEIGKAGEEPCKEEIRAKMITIVVDKLGVDPSELTDEAKFKNDLGADQLDFVELIMEFEMKFSFSIPDEDAEKIHTFGQAFAYVCKQLKCDC